MALEEMIPPQLLEAPRTVVALVNLKEKHHLFIPPLVGEESTPERYEATPDIKFRVQSTTTAALGGVHLRWVAGHLSGPWAAIP